MANETKLAVILHADVASSTALVQRDEVGAHRAIQSTFRRLSESVSAYGGIVEEVRGDALVAVFNRASDATLAALAFQRGRSEPADGTDESTLDAALRIGIALGEVVIADGTVTGAGVVLAQRVEQLAEVGGVCISAAVQEALPKRLPLEIESLGEQELKGFEERSRVYRAEIRAGEALPPPSPEQSKHAPRERSLFAERPSIVVLPFTTRGTEEDEVLCDGISEDLTTGLSAVRWLLVIARPVALEIWQRTTDVRLIGEELDVRYVLTGSVRRVSSRVRVSAQLNDARSGSQLWSHRYDRVLDDLFELQDELARSIAAEIAPQLVRAELGLVTRVRAENLSAWMAYQRGLTSLHRYDPVGFSEARRFLEQALISDPRFGSALSALAYVTFHELARGLPSRDGKLATVDDISALAEAALALDAQDGTAHMVLALAHLLRGNLESALIAVQRGVDLYPSSVFGYYVRAAVRALGAHQPSEALADIEFANRLSPSASASDAFSPLRLPIMAFANLLLKNYAVAAEVGEEACRAGSFYGPMTACIARRAQGNHERARELVKLMLDRTPSLTAAQLRERMPYLGDLLDWWLSELVSAGLPAT